MNHTKVLALIMAIQEDTAEATAASSEAALDIGGYEQAVASTASHVTELLLLLCGSNMPHLSIITSCVDLMTDHITCQLCDDTQLGQLDELRSAMLEATGTRLQRASSIMAETAENTDADEAFAVESPRDFSVN